MAGIADARLGGDPAGPVDLWDCVDALRCPTLVIRGAQSDFLPVSTCIEMAARQPRLTWVEVPDADHYVHDNNPTGYLQAVEPALRQAAP
jgi:pimeloyl-ACP methyl ester carboxylesterase